MNIKFEKISNGLLIACDQMHNVNSVSLNITVNIGSRHEEKQEYGISHFMEHMAFKGTNIYNKKQIASKLDQLGGSYNAYTAKEYTCYVCKVPSIYLEEAFSVLAEIINNSIFDPQEISLERDVILQEMAMINDDPSDIIFDKFYQICYPDQSFGAPIIGTAENIIKFNREDFINFSQKYYHNQNIIIATAGNLKFEQLQDLCLQYFPAKTNNPNQKIIQKTNLSTPEFVGGDYREERDIEQAHIIIGLPGVSKNDPDYFKMQLAVNILGSGMSSRLFQHIRENLGLAYHVSACNNSYYDTGVFVLYGAVSPENANKFIIESLQEMVNMIQNITIQEIEENKKQIRCGLLMQTDATNSRVNHLISCLNTYGHYITNEELIEKIDQISIDDVRSILLQTLKKGLQNSTLSLIGQVSKIMDYETFKNEYSKITEKILQN